MQKPRTVWVTKYWAGSGVFEAVYLRETINSSEQQQAGKSIKPSIVVAAAGFGYDGTLFLSKNCWFDTRQEAEVALKKKVASQRKSLERKLEKLMKNADPENFLPISTEKLDEALRVLERETSSRRTASS